MLSVRLAKDVERNIAAMASKMNVTKAAFLRNAILEYMEDRMDYLEALEALKEIDDLKSKGQKATYSLEELNETYGYDVRN